jgi:hypothetical protein
MCDLALAEAKKPLGTLAWERGVVGVPETIIRDGKVFQTKVKPSDSIFRMLLQASDPKKYGRPSRGGATRKQIEAKLRKKIEKEVRAEIVGEEYADLDEVCLALARQLKKFPPTGGGNGEESE